MPDPVAPTHLPGNRATVPGAADPVAGNSASATSAGGNATVPDISADFYRVVVSFADSLPGLVQTSAVIFTEAGVVVLGMLMVLRWWRARAETATRMGPALLAPIATVVAYAMSESAKSVLEQDRPCRAVPGAVPPLAECPPLGDWSFPSNHSTIAGAAAIAVLLSRRPGGSDTRREQRSWIGPFAVCLGALVACSRVFVGVHYPHDVLTGFLLGTAVAACVLTYAAPTSASAVQWWRERPSGRALLGSGPSAPVPELSDVPDSPTATEHAGDDGIVYAGDAVHEGDAVDECDESPGQTDDSVGVADDSVGYDDYVGDDESIMAEYGTDTKDTTVLGSPLRHAADGAPTEVLTAQHPATPERHPTSGRRHGARAPYPHDPGPSTEPYPAWEREVSGARGDETATRPLPRTTHWPPEYRTWPPRSR